MHPNVISQFYIHPIGDELIVAQRAFSYNILENLVRSDMRRPKYFSICLCSFTRPQDERRVGLSLLFTGKTVKIVDTLALLYMYIFHIRTAGPI